MAIQSIYDYTLYTNTNPTGEKSKTRGKGSADMDMNDFLNLLVAQMQNQDIMNPQNDTEFVAQMAQFSALQGIQTLGEYAQTSYAVSYVGKYVLVAHQDPKSGKIEEIVGKVDSVNFYNGEPRVFIGEESYPLYTVMEVSDKPIEIEKPEDTTGKTENETDPDDDTPPVDNGTDAE